MHKRLMMGAAAVVLVLACASCGSSPDNKPAAKPSPSYSGPSWEAYKAGRAYGAEHQDTATIPESVARTSDPKGTLGDALNADRENAEWWCRRNLPSELETEHEAEEDTLLAGCVGGVLPMHDHPEVWVDKSPWKPWSE